MKKKQRRLWISAADAVAGLEADPDWVARRDAAERERAQRKAALDEEARALVGDLADAGIAVTSVWDLVQMTEPYHAAVPVLVRHLARQYSPRTREGIVRALTTPEARLAAWHPLLDLYREIGIPVDPLTDSLKDAVANALAHLAGKARMREVIQLVREDQHGDSRIFLVEALGRIGDESVIPLLEDLIARGQLTRAAKQALRAIQRRTKP